jgi:hypothetical protein
VFLLTTRDFLYSYFLLPVLVLRETFHDMESVPFLKYLPLLTILFTKFVTEENVGFVQLSHVFFFLFYFCYRGVCYFLAESDLCVM